MVRLDTNNWYRLEGMILPVSEYNYQTPIVNLNGMDIWYTDVEVRLQNPNSYSFIHGVNYKIRKFSELGSTTIEQIDANYYPTLNNALSIMAVNEGSLTYTEPIVVTESSIICYGDALGNGLPNYLVILKDTARTVKIVGVTTQYNGPAIAVGLPFDPTKLVVTGHFDDGHHSELVADTYKVTNASGVESMVITTVGSNIFTATVTYGENVLTSSFTVPGIKRLVGITARYDGIAIAVGKAPSRSSIIVIANYSDGSSSTVTDWTYKNGDLVTTANNGILDLYYEGMECQVTITHYTSIATQIKAFYNGPNIEINKNFLLENLTVKIYYQDATGVNSYWEELLSGTYTVESTLIKFEGDNIVTVSYITAGGVVLTTNFIVKGFEPEKELSYLTAEYVGPPIMVGKPFNPSKVVCKAYWSNGDITLVTNFTLSVTTIQKVGANTITLSYKEKGCTFNINGVEVESTTGNGYSPTKMNLLYPEATRLNHRRRGPMESGKMTEYNQFVYENITKLYKVYEEIEKAYKTMYNDMNSMYGTGKDTLNKCSIIQDKINGLSK